MILWIPLKKWRGSNLHRFLSHHLWFVKRVVIPIFGHSYICGNEKVVNVKDNLETNHLIADFHGFMPSLSDYVNLLEEDKNDKFLFEEFRIQNKELLDNPDIYELMYSPLANTGKITSLFLTHNSWFLNDILPRLYPSLKIKIQNSIISPSLFLNRCRYDDWIDNGHGKPPSFAKITKRRKEKEESKKENKQSIPLSSMNKDKIFYDGSNLARFPILDYLKQNPQNLYPLGVEHTD